MLNNSLDGNDVGGNDHSQLIVVARPGNVNADGNVDADGVTDVRHFNLWSVSKFSGKGLLAPRRPMNSAHHKWLLVAVTARW